MTKRKASVALETGNESNQSTSTQDNNSNSTTATINTTGPNNNTNQGAQNGSSSGSNNGGKQTGEGQHKSKKERADNWSSAEIQVLHRGIESRRDIFYGPPSQATKRNRELAWDAITKEVNSVSTTPRTLSQVMKKFKNEKCRAKRKFIDSEKDGHNNIGNTGSVNSSNGNNGTNSNNTTANTNLSAQNHNSATNNQQLQSQQQAHHMTTAESMSSQQSSINVVKLAPQNVAKTMIDLPGHVQQIQMPNDDMVLIVPPEMDGLLSGMNIVSDGHHQFQKCSSISTLNNQQHSNHGHHAIQAINTGQGLMNGAMGNGMMARTIPAGSMCSLVYSTGNEVCGSEQHITSNVAGPNQLSTNHISVNAQNLMHHRTPVDQTQGQQQQQPQQQHPHHHQLHQHQPHQTHQQQQQQPQPPQQQQQQQQQPQAPHQSHPQSHQPAQHHQPQLQQNHLATGTNIANSGGAAVESQLKNLLFNLLLKDGQHLAQVGPSTPDYNKQRNDILAIIAGSLNKIEGHLCKISKVAGSLFSQNINSAGETATVITSAALNSQNNSLANNDGNNNNVSITGTGSATGISNQGGSDG